MRCNVPPEKRPGAALPCYITFCGLCILFYRKVVGRYSGLIRQRFVGFSGHCTLQKVLPTPGLASPTVPAVP